MRLTNTTSAQDNMLTEAEDSTLIQDLVDLCEELDSELTRATERITELESDAKDYEKEIEAHERAAELKATGGE